LRQRVDDIELLVQFFIGQFCAGRHVEIAPQDLERLKQHVWPGNVRELSNVIERACALCRGDRLEIDEAFEPRPAVEAPATGVDINLPFKLAKSRIIDAFEREYIQALLARHKGNLSAASRSAEVDRKHFRELLRKHGLRESSDP
jgi:two-component system nitrogen regulation response regulator GlnG